MIKHFIKRIIVIRYEIEVSMKDFFGYKVKENGEVYSKKTGKLMRPANNKKGYLIHNLRINGKSKCIAVHRIVALCYIPNPDNLSDVDHIDGDRKNNHVSNLRWLSHGDNIRHSYYLGSRSAVGENNARATLNKKKLLLQFAIC